MVLLGGLVTAILAESSATAFPADSSESTTTPSFFASSSITKNYFGWSTDDMSTKTFVRTFLLVFIVYLLFAGEEKPAWFCWFTVL